MKTVIIDETRDDLLTESGKLLFKSYQLANESCQDTYKRLAENFGSDVTSAQDIYDMVSKHQVTFATPIMKQSGISNQYSSCCVMRMDDDSTSIRECVSEAAHAGSLGYGLGVDMGVLRANRSKIGNYGVSPGPIGFIKMLEASTIVWTQAGGRPVSACVFVPWYHQDIADIAVLKSNGGTDETRARRLKYAIKIDDVFIERVQKNETVTLVERPAIFETLHGDEFRKAYEEFERQNQDKPKMNARDLWKLILKERVETGNIYLFHKDNTNKLSMFDEIITQSNLCTEITLPTIIKE